MASHLLIHLALAAAAASSPAAATSGVSAKGGPPQAKDCASLSAPLFWGERGAAGPTIAAAASANFAAVARQFVNARSGARGFSVELNAGVRRLLTWEGVDPGTLRRVGDEAYEGKILFRDEAGQRWTGLFTVDLSGGRRKVIKASLAGREVNLAPK